MMRMTRAEAAREALRWVTDAAVPVPGGLAWPETRQPDGRVSDDLYDGTAGVLMALSEASGGHTTTGHLRDGRSAYPGRAGVPHPGS